MITFRSHAIFSAAGVCIVPTICEVVVGAVLIYGGVEHCTEILIRKQVPHPEDRADGTEQERLDDVWRLLVIVRNMSMHRCRRVAADGVRDLHIDAFLVLSFWLVILSMKLVSSHYHRRGRDCLFLLDSWPTRTYYSAASTSGWHLYGIVRATERSLRNSQGIVRQGKVGCMYVGGTQKRER